MFYDTHAHLNLRAFNEDYKEVTQQSLGAGMVLNNVGTQKDTSAKAVKIANEFAAQTAEGKGGVYAVVGLHPTHTISQEIDEEESHFKSREEKFDYEFYKKLAADPKVVGIGECGLDYYHMPDGMSREQVRGIQSQAFIAQLKLAKEMNKALVIHCRASQGAAAGKGSTDAYEDILEILAEHKPERFEIHSFTSNWEIAQRFLELGAYIGMNGIITFDKSGVLKEVVANTPLEKIVLETDAPYLAPGPFRGKRCLPEYVKYTAEFIAQVKDLPVELVAGTTMENGRELFKI